MSYQSRLIVIFQHYSYMHVCNSDNPKSFIVYVYTIAVERVDFSEMTLLELLMHYTSHGDWRTVKVKADLMFTGPLTTILPFLSG